MQVGTWRDAEKCISVVRGLVTENCDIYLPEGAT